MGGHTPVLVYGGFILTLLQTSFGSNDTASWCLDTTPDSNATVFEMDSMTTASGIIYHLYQVNSSGLTWCESYQACEAQGQSLAVLDTKQLQEDITSLNLGDVTRVWIAGRRKDYGSNWTWINASLTDVSDNLTIYDRNNSSKDCGRVTLTRSGTKEITADFCDLPKAFICFSGSVTKSTLSWNEAMNYCVDIGSRLATLEEITTKPDANSYWFGLQRRPWLWAESDQGGRPVLYSSWGSQSGGDCMTLLSNGSWLATPCTDQLQYFLCQDPVQPTTEFSTVSPSGESAKGNRPGKDLTTRDLIIIGVAVAVVVIVIVIVVVAVYWLKRGRKNSVNDKIHSVVTANCEEVGPKSNEYSLESAAYKPSLATDTISPYAELKMSPAEPKPVNTSDPIYSLAKGPSNREPFKSTCTETNNAVYADVKKHKSDETTLFDNVAYGTLTKNKKPPPKPKRLAQL